MRWVVYAIALSLALVAGASFVSAATCPDIVSRNTQSLLTEISSINTQLQTCPIPLPLSMRLLMSDPTRVDIQMDDGTTQNLMLTIQNGQVTGVTQGTGACKRRIVTTEDVLNQVLKSSDRGRAALFWYGRKGFQLTGCSFISRASLGVLNPIGRFFSRSTGPSQPPAIQQTWGKPDYCDETWLPGHRGYADNQALWDSYSANADGVCQSQFGRGTPNPCVHAVQLSVSGNPYYLCWYKN